MTTKSTETIFEQQAREQYESVKWCKCGHSRADHPHNACAVPGCICKGYCAADKVAVATPLPQRMYIKEDYDDRGVETYYVSSTKDDAEYVEYRAYSPARDAAFNVMVEALKRAQVLCRLLTVRQVIIEGGDKYIEAAGLNPWAINEGLATGDERIDPPFIDTALKLAEEASQ